MPKFTLVRSLLLGSLVSLAVLVSTATAALGSTITQRTNLSYCASLGAPCTSPWWANAGQQVNMKCWEDSSWAFGTNRWFIVFETTPPWYAGWVSANLVAGQTRTPHC